MGMFRGSNLRRRVGGEEVSDYLPITPPILDSAFAYYSMEEASGTRVDALGTYDLSVINTDQPNTTGINNDCWAPDTTQGWLRNTSLVLGGSDGMSISVWVAMPTATYSQGRYICAENTNSNTAFRMSIGNWPTNLGEFMARNASVVASSGVTSTPVDWVNSNWRHLVGTWGDGDASARIYVDGVERGVGSPIALNGLRDNGAQGILVGTYHLPGNFNFGYTSNPAWMDELVIFDFNIGQAGVTELWNGGAGLFL